MDRKLVHATCLVLDTVGGPRGVLLRGPSGAGKSDLALRLIDRGARLVADDQCELQRIESAAGAYVRARAPATIAGALEVRGLGIVGVPTLPEAPIALLVDLVAAEAIERLPEPVDEEILGVTLPRIVLDPFAEAAVAKLRVALRVRAQQDATESRAGRAIATARAGPAAAGRGQRRVVLVTGLSGAGHSTALKILEDLGYEAIDNLPLPLIDAVLAEEEPNRPIAIGIDIRSRRFAAPALLDHIDRLRARSGLAISLLFLDCEDSVLERRFTETRRRHPLARDRRVADGIVAERRLVAPLRERADLTIDTSTLTPGELRRSLHGHLGLEQGPGMSIFVTSFSYRYGLPREADLVFDVRFLANPHYVPELQPLDGRDPRVASYVEEDPAFNDFIERLTGVLGPLLPRYQQEGKSYLTIAIGCTGGRHRSVVIAERLALWLRRLGHSVDVRHRDVAAGGAAPGGATGKERDLPAKSR